MAKFQNIEMFEMTGEPSSAPSSDNQILYLSNGKLNLYDEYQQNTRILTEKVNSLSPASGVFNNYSKIMIAGKDGSTQRDYQYMSLDIFATLLDNVLDYAHPFYWEGVPINDINSMGLLGGVGIDVNTNENPANSGFYQSEIKLGEITAEVVNGSQFNKIPVINSSNNWKVISPINAALVLNDKQIHYTDYDNHNNSNSQGVIIRVPINNYSNTFVYEAMLMFGLPSGGIEKGYGVFRVSGIIQRNQAPDIVAKEVVELFNSLSLSITDIIVEWDNTLNAIIFKSNNLYTDAWETYIHLSYSLPDAWD